MNIAATMAVINYVMDSMGENALSPDSLPHVRTYNGSNQILTDTVTDGTNTWVQTYTYTGSNLTGLSAWVLQTS
jgi:hypothetical protein